MNCKECKYYQANKDREGFGYCNALPPKPMYIGKYTIDGKEIKPQYVTTISETWAVKKACIYFGENDVSSL